MLLHSRRVGMEVWQDFGQKIDLAVRIRDILHDYPEGTSVLKELIQVRMLSSEHNRPAGNFFLIRTL